MVLFRSLLHIIVFIIQFVFTEVTLWSQGHKMYGHCNLLLKYHSIVHIIFYIACQANYSIFQLTTKFEEKKLLDNYYTVVD